MTTRAQRVIPTPQRLIHSDDDDGAVRRKHDGVNTTGEPSMRTGSKHVLLAFALPCTLALSSMPALTQQPPLTTEFPPDAKETTPEDLRQRLAGKVFRYTVGTTGVRLQFQDSYAFVNFGQNNDTGPWRTEGSKLCVEWKRLPNNCADMRLVGDTVYMKRASTGEVLRFEQQ